MRFCIVGSYHSPLVELCGKSAVPGRHPARLYSALWRLSSDLAPRVGGGWGTSTQVSRPPRRIRADQVAQPHLGFSPSKPTTHNMFHTSTRASSFDDAGLSPARLISTFVSSGVLSSLTSAAHQISASKQSACPSAPNRPISSGDFRAPPARGRIDQHHPRLHASSTTELPPPPPPSCPMRPQSID